MTPAQNSHEPSQKIKEQQDDFEDKTTTEDHENSLELSPKTPSTGSGHEESLVRYIRQINAYPMLTEEEELGLAQRWIAHKDKKAAQALITSHLRLVVKIASGYRHYGFSLEDLISEGSTGLIKTLKNFDPSRGNRFSTYALWWIRAEITDYILYNWSLVKIGTTRAQKKLFFSMRHLKRKLQEQRENFSDVSQDDLEKISQRLEVPLKEVRAMDQRLRSRDFSLNVPLGPQGDEGEETEWQDLMISEDPNQEESFIEKDIHQKRKAILENFSRTLSHREYHIFFHRHLHEEPWTLESLGHHHDLSRERVRQIESTLLKKLKQCFPVHLIKAL